MAVVGIRQVYRRYVQLVVGPRGGRQGLVHLVPRKTQALYRSRGHVGSEIANSFFMNFVRPARVHETIRRELNESISEMEGIKDAGIVDDNGRLKDHNW